MKDVNVAGVDEPRGVGNGEGRERQGAPAVVFCFSQTLEFSSEELRALQQEDVLGPPDGGGGARHPQRGQIHRAPLS